MSHFAFSLSSVKVAGHRVCIFCCRKESTLAARKLGASGPKSSVLTQTGDVFGGGVPEKAAVFAAELRSTEVAHALARHTRVQHARKHKTPRLLEAQHLLIVQRAHRSDRLEVFVERGNTHVYQLGQVFDLHGLREVRA